MSLAFQSVMLKCIGRRVRARHRLPALFGLIVHFRSLRSIKLRRYLLVDTIAVAASHCQTKTTRDRPMSCFLTSAVSTVSLEGSARGSGAWCRESPSESAQVPPRYNDDRQSSRMQVRRFLTSTPLAAASTPLAARQARGAPAAPAFPPPAGSWGPTPRPAARSSPTTVS